jgi:hypothetical protein
VDGKRRLTISEIKKHPFFKETNWESVERGETQMPSILIKSPDANNFDEITMDSCDEDWQHEFEGESSDEDLPRNTILEDEMENEGSVILQMMDRPNKVAESNERLTSLSNPEYIECDEEYRQQMEESSCVPGFTFLGK